MKKLPDKHTGPGLLDLQLNGYAGVDFISESIQWDEKDLHSVRATISSDGVSAAVITFVTSSPESLVARGRHYRELVEADEDLARAFPALHVEGPFISSVTGPRGAHAEEHCTTPLEHPDLIDRVQEASGGRVAIVTLAPELPGAVDLTRRCAEQGICVAIGHTEATPEQIRRAVEAGARMSTHLGNGSHQTMPRLDNYVQAQLAEDRLWASFMSDGHHMPFTTLKNFIRAKTPQRSILVTDAIAATELPPGTYRFGEQEIEVSPDGRCQQRGEENLAGSVLSLDRAVVNTCLHCDVTFQQAWAMASTIPAKLIGLELPKEVTVSVTEKGFTRQ